MGVARNGKGPAEPATIAEARKEGKLGLTKEKRRPVW